MDNLELAKECGADTVEVIDGNFESPENPYFTYCFERHQLDEFASRLTADKDAEIERLNALVAMQAEALNKLLGINSHVSLYETIEELRQVDFDTAETVSAWQLKRDNEIRAKSVEKFADYLLEISKPFLTGSYRDGCEGAARIAKKCASELRAKGE